MNICDYGCGQEAKYQFKNGKWCCSKIYNQCPYIRKQKQGKNNPFFGKIHTKKVKNKLSMIKKETHLSAESIEKIKKSTSGKKNHNYGKTWKDSKETKLKKSNSNKGNIPWNKGKCGYFTTEQRDNISKKNKGRKPWNKNISHSNETKKKMSIQSKLTIEKIQIIYPLFTKIEEMRYNPDKPDKQEIQVHCKNHNCPNSKEQGGWFTPTFSQIQMRKNQLEKSDGNDGSYFYCTNKCKNECILYNLHSDPFKEIAQPYTQEEYQVWHEVVLKQDNYECQICGSKKDLCCHHIIPVKIEPIFALDPDNGIVLCKECHYEYGHKTGTECSTGNLAKKRCDE